MAKLTFLLTILILCKEWEAQAASSTTPPSTRPTGVPQPPRPTAVPPPPRPTAVPPPPRPTAVPTTLRPTPPPQFSTSTTSATTTTRKPILPGQTRVLTTMKTPRGRKINRKFGKNNQCEFLGFLGSNLNQCGFCVGGITELPGDFGVDCAGQCGKSYVDCAGQCGGSAYIDECSGQCIASSDAEIFRKEPNIIPIGPVGAIDPNIPKPEKYQEKVKDTAQIVLPRDLDSVQLEKRGRVIARQLDGVTGRQSGRNGTFFPQPRDCRGLCELDHRPTNFSFALDVCGICVIQFESPTVNRTTPASRNSTTGTGTALANGTTSASTVRQPLRSKYKDCSGVCFAPGAKRNMAVNNSDTCNQCVGPLSRYTLNDAKDECGRCRKDNIPCPCPMDKQDMCGVCGGKNDTCTTVVRVSPAAIPGGNTTTVNVTGVALKNKHHVVCLMIRQDIQADGKDEEKFPAAIRTTGVTCDINAPEGSYRFHLAITLDNGDILSISNSSVPFVVYNRLATFTQMSPTTLTVLDDVNSFNVKFAATNLQRIKKIYCLMQGEAFPKPIEVTSELVYPNEAVCKLPFPKHSSVANVSVSIDGLKYVAGPFQLKFFSPMPYATDAYLLAEGNNIVIFFDRDVAINRTANCSDILTKTSMTELGENATCQWITKSQLIVTFGDPIKTKGRNDSYYVKKETFIRFRDDVLFTDKELYAEGTKNLSLSFTFSDEVPIAVLAGPRQVPSCGSFLLDGHQSIKTQSRRVRFKWDVTSSNPAAINQSLLDFLDEQTLNNSASFFVNVNVLQPEVDYTFVMTIFNGYDGRLDANRTRVRTNKTTSPRAPLTELVGRVGGERNRSSSASVTVTRDSLNVPIVMIEPSIASYPRAVAVDKRFTLNAYLSMPPCQHEVFSINYKWTVDNPRVKFDMTQMEKKSYTVEPYTLPPGENVTFDLEVTLNNDLNLTSRAAISFNVTSSLIKAVLQGGYQRSVGNDSGYLVLNMSQSYYVDLPYLPLVYRWECFEEDNSPCYNYHPNANETLLVPQPITRGPILAIRSSGLRPDALLNVYVRAFSPLNSSEISDIRNVAIRVINGSSPVVSIDSITVQDKNVVKPEMEDMIHLVPSMTDVIVTASIYHNVPLANVSWSIPGFLVNLTAYAMNHTVNQSTLATLTIRKEYLAANGIYKVNATATNVRGESGWAIAAFTVLSPVAKCNILVDDYEAFSMIEVKVESCTASQHNFPLSYQVFVQDRFNYISLNSPSFHLPLAIMGPPAYMGDNTTTPQNIFTVEVCDNLNSCWRFNSSKVNVKQVTDFQMAGEHAFYMANIAKLQENFLSCLRRHALYLKAMQPRYRSKHEVEFESQMAESFLCARRAADDECVDPGCFANLFNFITYLPVETNPGRDFMLIEVMQKAIDRLTKNNFTLTEYGAQQGFLVLEKIYKYNSTNTEVSQHVKRMSEQLQNVLARSLQPDENPKIIDSTGHIAFAMKYTLFNDTFVVDVQPDSNKTASLEFSKSLRKRFDSWNCENSSKVCHGVVAEMQFYPEHLYRPMDVNPNRTVSEIVKVVLLNPATGERILKSEKAKTTLTMNVDPALIWSNLTYDCYAWNDKDQLWTTDDVDTDITNSSIFKCESKYLATLAVIGSEPRLSAGIIAAIVIGVLLVIVGISLAAFFIYKKARTKTMRVSISKGYQPNVQ